MTAAHHDTDRRTADLATDDARTPRTFLAARDDDTELVFRPTETYTNSYGDKRVVVETPAPWDVPDDFDGADPNEVIKSLPWGDDDDGVDEADLDGGAYYAFDDDDLDAPAAAADAWSLEVGAAQELRERALAAGYEWDAFGDEDDEDTLVHRAVAFVREGDFVRVRYEKKNGNGIAAYVGPVRRVLEDTDRTHGIAFEDGGGKYKCIKNDDDGEPALFCGGHAPYMGAVVSLEVEPHEVADERETTDADADAGA
jgi:hypothetical protein